MERKLPNILVTGTPGVGKSTLCSRVAEETGLKWQEVSKISKDYFCTEDYDGEYGCPFLNEDKLLDVMESMMAKGGNIVDYHGCDFFPQRWFDAVFVLRTNNTVLYDRLQERGYKGKKLTDNVECEIFNMILEEALSSYSEAIVQELENNSLDDKERNLNKIIQWVKDWNNGKNA